MTILFLGAATLSTAACKGKSPEAQCEDIYKKGDGTASYKTDKNAFMDACKKTSDTTRKCLLESGKERFKDKDCGPDGANNTFDEQMQIVKLGQGTP
jgi:hypothetical protein